jgi:hypothetical protein
MLPAAGQRSNTGSLPMIEYTVGWMQRGGTGVDGGVPVQ